MQQHIAFASVVALAKTTNVLCKCKIVFTLAFAVFNIFLQKPFESANAAANAILFSTSIFHK